MIKMNENLYEYGWDYDYGDYEEDPYGLYEYGRDYDYGDAEEE